MNLPLRFRAAAAAAAMLTAAGSACAVEATIVWSSANAALVTTPDAITQSVAGVAVAARGYVAEFDDSNPALSTIIGPFSTAFAGNHQIFGPRTANKNDNKSYGLGLFVSPSPGIAPTGVDYGGSAYAAVFDSGGCCFGAYLGDNPDVPGSPRHAKTDFTVMSFSQPVDVERFNTDTANAWWAAGWQGAPDLSGGLSQALSTASVVQGRGSQTDPFTHVLSGFTGVTTLAIGYAPTVPGYESLGPYNLGGFYLYSVTISPVPEAGSGWLFGGGLLTLIVAVRRRAVAVRQSKLAWASSLAAEHFRGAQRVHYNAEELSL